MENQYAAPIDHSAGSAFANKTTGAVGGAVKGGIKWAAIWAGLFVIGGIAAGIGIAGLGLFTAAPVLNAVVGTIAGLGIALGGIASSSFAGVLGGAVGGVKGGGRAAERVRDERAAAAMLQAQVEVAKAQAPMVAYANDNKYNFPAQGSAMNPAMGSIQADTAQGLGPVNGQQRQIG